MVRSDPSLHNLCAWELRIGAFSREGLEPNRLFFNKARPEEAMQFESVLSVGRDESLNHGIIQ